MTVITARPAGFFRDIASIASRSIRQLPRDIEFIGPALFIPVFFLIVNVGSRRALLLGHMAADFVLVICLSIPVVIVGFIIGVRFPTGPLGVVVFILIAALWGVAYTGIPYAIALKTGNPGAVNSSFMLFFPFAFLTTSYVPVEAMTGWMATIARYNPVTYLLAGLRSLFIEWQWGELGESLIAIGALALVSQSMSFKALNGRVK